MLAPLGFDAVEEAVYRSLVEQPGSGAASFCEAGLDVEAVTHALEGLVERGLASAERHDDGLRYQAAPPLLALGPVLESRRAALYRVEHLLAEMAESHRAAQSRVSGAPVEVLTGAAAIRRRLVAMQRDARYEVRSLVPAMDSPVVISHADICLTSREGSRPRELMALRFDSFWSAPTGDLSAKKRLGNPGSTYGGQFSVNDEYFAYSTYDAWGAAGGWSGYLGKVQAAPVADVVAGTAEFTRVSCSSGFQLAPSLGTGQRAVWLDTTAASTDVVTRGSFARTCE
jgi:hypothetical protein